MAGTALIDFPAITVCGLDKSVQHDLNDTFEETVAKVESTPDIITSIYFNRYSYNVCRQIERQKKF